MGGKKGYSAVLVAKALSNEPEQHFVDRGNQVMDGDSQHFEWRNAVY